MKLTYDEVNLPELAGDFIQLIKHKIVTFQGEMGVGKTTLIKHLCATLGAKGNISSPTFSLVNEYEISNTEKIYHFDFYRLKTETEALDIGIDDYLDSGHWCFIEWPEKIQNLLKIPHSQINIQLLEDNSRLLTDYDYD